MVCNQAKACSQIALTKPESGYNHLFSSGFSKIGLSILDAIEEPLIGGLIPWICYFDTNLTDCVGTDRGTSGLLEIPNVTADKELET